MGKGANTNGTKSSRMGRTKFQTLQGNTGPTPPTNYDGFSYTLEYDNTIGEWTYCIYDSAGTLVHKGTVMGRPFDYQIAESNARDWIDQQNSGDIGDIDYPDLEPNWFAVLSDRCYTVETWNVATSAGIGKELYQWRIKDINGSVIFTQSFPNSLDETRKDYQQYLVGLPDQAGCEQTENGGSNGGSEGDSADTSGDFAVIGLFAILAVGYILFEAFKGESPIGS